MQEFLSQIPSDAAATFLRLLILCVLFLITWILRNRIGKLLIIPIRALINKTKSEADDFFFVSIEKVMGYIVLAVPLFVSTLILPMSANEQRIVTNIALTLIIFALFSFLFDVGTRLFNSSVRLKRITGYDLDPALMPIVQLCAKVIVLTFGVLTITQLWGWNVAGLVAGVGIGGLAISLAAKDILDDILGYGVLIADNVLRENEYIVSPYAEGIVENIGVVSTRIRQLNQGLVTVPNAKLSDDWVVNWSRLEKRWFNFMVGLTYSSTAEQIQQFVSTLSERLKQREHVQEDSVVVLFTEYADSSLNVLVRCYVDLPDWVEAHAERQAANLMIMNTLAEIGLEVAFPSRSLYLEDMPSGLASLQSNRDKHASSQDGGAPQTQKESQSGQSPYPQDDDSPEIAEKSQASDDEGELG